MLEEKEKKSNRTFAEWVNTMKISLTKVLFLSVSLITGVRTLQAGVETGWDHFKKQEYELAAAEFEHAIALGMDEAATRDGLGWSYYWLGRFDQAEQEFTKALEMEPTLAGAARGLGEVNKWRYMQFNDAWQMFNNKEYQNALLVFLAILDDKSGRLPAADIWKVHSGVGWCYYYLQNYTTAEKSFRNILQIYKNNAYALKGLGLTLYQLGKFDESREALVKSIVEHPEWADAVSIIGWCHYSKNEFDAALASFSKSYEINCLNSDAMYGTAWTYHRLDRQEDALTNFREAIKLSPYHPSTYNLMSTIDKNKSWWTLYADLAWSYYSMGDYNSALTVFGDALMKMPVDLDLLRGRAFCNFKLGNYDSVIDELLKVEDDSSGLAPVVEAGETSDGVEFTVRSNVRSILAWCYYYKGDYSKAGSYFEKDLALFPDWVDLHTGLGWCALQENDLKTSRSHFSKALEINPYYSVAKQGMAEHKNKRYSDFNSAWNAYYSGDLQSAEDRFRKLIQSGTANIDPEDQWRVYSGFGWSALGNDHLGDARTAFTKVLELSENNFYGYLGLARTEYRSKNFKEADRNIDLALIQNSELADAWSLKGWIEMELKHSSPAEKSFRKALEILATDADALAGLGWCSIPDTKKAREYFKSALTLDPDHAKAGEGLKSLGNEKKGE